MKKLWHKKSDKCHALTRKLQQKTVLKNKTATTLHIKTMKHVHKRERERQNRKENMSASTISTSEQDLHIPTMHLYLSPCLGSVFLSLQESLRNDEMKTEGRRGTCRAYSVTRGWSRQIIRFNSIIIELLKVIILWSVPWELLRVQTKAVLELCCHINCKANKPSL